jgi:hypothetical protein
MEPMIMRVIRLQEIPATRMTIQLQLLPAANTDGPFHLLEIIVNIRLVLAGKKNIEEGLRLYLGLTRALDTIHLRPNYPQQATLVILLLVNITIDMIDDLRATNTRTLLLHLEREALLVYRPDEMIMKGRLGM